MGSYPFRAMPNLDRRFYNPGLQSPGVNNFLDPEAMLNNALTQGQNQPTMADRAEIARSRGFQVQGNQAVSRGPTGIPTYMSLDSFAPPPVPGSQYDPMMLGALLSDTNRMQGAADRQFMRNQAQIDSMGAFLGGLQPTLDAQAAGFQNELRGFGSQAQALGDQQVDRIERSNAETRARQDPLIDSAMDTQKLAEWGMADAVNRFEDRAAQDASAVAEGIRRSMKTSLKMARSGMRPDGSSMTAEEQHAVMQEMEFETGRQVQAAITPLMSDYNRARASLDQSLASLRSQGAATRLQAAGQVASTDQAGTQNLLAAQAGRRDMANLASSLSQAGAQLRQTALLTAVQLEAQGRMNLAQLVQQNPETIVSWFQGLLAMQGVDAATNGLGGGGISMGGGGGTQSAVRTSTTGGQSSAAGRTAQAGQTSQAPRTTNPSNLGFMGYQGTSRPRSDTQRGGSYGSPTWNDGTAYA